MNKAKAGKKGRKHGRSKRKAMSKNNPIALYSRGSISFEQYLKRTKSSH